MTIVQISFHCILKERAKEISTLDEKPDYDKLTFIVTKKTTAMSIKKSQRH